MIQGNAFDAYAIVDSFSLLYLNPPYDSEIDLTGNRRLERLFLEHTYHWLVPHGILVLVISFEQLKDCASLLGAYFTRVTVFRMEDTESVRLRQVAVFGVRRNLRGPAHEENRKRLVLLTGNDGYTKMPFIQQGVSAPFSEWAEGMVRILEDHNRIKPLEGIACAPILVSASAEEILDGSRRCSRHPGIS